MRLARLVALLLFVLSGRGAAQTLSIEFHGAAGEPVPITRAQILMTGWGAYDQKDLPFTGNVVQLDLGRTRPDFAVGLADSRGFIYVKADGYAPIMSQAFTWPSEKAPTSVISFRNRQLAMVKGHARLSVQMRRPLPRRIRLVDTDSNPVAGVRVVAAAYWSSPNHCGFLAGRDVFVTDVTRADGTLDVPDVDGLHAFTLEERLIVFDERVRIEDGWPGKDLVLPLTNAETTLHVRRYRAQRLAVDLVDNGQPLPRAVLWADMGAGTCGAGTVPLATADARGRVVLDEFYPDFWHYYWVCVNGTLTWITPGERQRLPRTLDIARAPSGDKNNRFPSMCRL
jgi:hypothetical protein